MEAADSAEGTGARAMSSVRASFSSRLFCSAGSVWVGTDSSV
jgi:hypothetical protein